MQIMKTFVNKIPKTNRFKFNTIDTIKLISNRGNFKLFMSNTSCSMRVDIIHSKETSFNEEGKFCNLTLSANFRILHSLNQGPVDVLTPTVLRFLIENSLAKGQNWHMLLCG